MIKKEMVAKLVKITEEEIVKLEKEGQNITVEKILLEAGYRFYMMWQDLELFSKSEASSYNNSFFRATALVELVEVFDCGSIGGFGEGLAVPNGERTHYTLWERFADLYKRYIGDKKLFNKSCYNGMNYDKLNKYFTKRE